MKRLMIYFDNMGKLSLSPNDKVAFFKSDATAESVFETIHAGAVVVNMDHVSYMKVREFPDEPDGDD